jgi:class I fructose-bisphosphate aldolase
MTLSPRVKEILSFYESDNPGVKTSLARMLMQGKLSGTGNLIILPVDQGFEHGPDRSYAANQEAYNPHYHFQLAVDAGLSAYAAPLGWLEAGAATFAGAIPTILKMNSSNSLLSKTVTPNQAVTASVKDALRLGCVAIGFTIYPGSDSSLEMFEEIHELSLEAKSCGLAVIIWSYARGNMSKDGETAMDVISYGAHMAALLGAHIIKVKLPSEHLEVAEAKQQYIAHSIKINTLAERVSHVKKCCFDGRRLIVFSGGESRDDQSIIADAKSIKAGGGNGSIIGRNCFQRPRQQALALLEQLVKVYN